MRALNTSINFFCNTEIGKPKSPATILIQEYLENQLTDKSSIRKIIMWLEYVKMKKLEDAKNKSRDLCIHYVNIRNIFFEKEIADWLAMYNYFFTIMLIIT